MIATVRVRECSTYYDECSWFEREGVGDSDLSVADIPADLWARYQEALAEVDRIETEIRPLVEKELRRKRQNHNARARRVRP